MEDAEQLNSFLVDVFGRINKIEERAMAGGLGSGGLRAARPTKQI